ncbi:MAG: hypothetical protein C4539_18780 [Ignavibacteriales bacterium]|nr:MAG: hypothetical protein C4539_18780 [Ignavibacteriales bacterium]
MKYTKIMFIVFVLIAALINSNYAQVADTSTIQKTSMLENQNRDEIKIPLSIMLAHNYLDDKEKAENILQLNSSLPGVNAETDKSSFTTDLFYVLGTAAVAAIVYFFWPEKESTPVSTVTFGKPVHP